MSPTLHNEVFGGAPEQASVDAAISAKLEQLGAHEIDRFLDEQIDTVAASYDTNPPERFEEYCRSFRTNAEIRAQIAFALSNVREETGTRLGILKLDVQQRIAGRWIEYRDATERLAIQTATRTERILAGMGAANDETSHFEAAA